MPGAITDLITRVTDSSSGRPAVTSLAAPKALAAASVTITDGTNWTTESAVYFAIYETNAAGMKLQATQTDWKATRVGTTLSNLTLTGGTDRTYTAGAIVEQTPTARYVKDNYDWAMAHADQDGTLKAGAVDNAAVLASNVVTTAKILNANVTPEKRAGGFKIGFISTATLGTTGNKAITGVGFTPKLVRFRLLPGTSTANSITSSGSMDGTSQFAETTFGTGSTNYRHQSKSAAIALSLNGSTFDLLASYVSMDADGFTINVSTASSSFEVAYEAYA